VDADAWDSRYAETELVWSAGPNQFVVEHLDGLPPGRALDLAAGEGRNAVWLATKGWAVTAVDFSPVAIDKGRAVADHHGVTVDWRVADAVGFRPDAATFDLALICYLHLPPDDLATVITGAVGALGPGGTFLLVGHDRRNLADGTGGPQDPSILTRADEVAPLLGELTIEFAGDVERSVATDDGPAVAIDTLVRARR
jgi:SAM-dependent methyltransferase